ncbi:hypothetical protein EJB05_57796, partial [Eragrostis curvula]
TRGASPPRRHYSLRRPCGYKETPRLHREDLSVGTKFYYNDGFVIPSLSVEESDLGDWEASRASDPQPPPKQPAKDTENIYLGPHGAPPSRAKKPEDTSATTGYRDKNKVREADQKAFGTGRHNKGGNTGDFHRYNAANHGVQGTCILDHTYVNSPSRGKKVEDTSTTRGFRNRNKVRKLIKRRLELNERRKQEIADMPSEVYHGENC